MADPTNSVRKTTKKKRPIPRHLVRREEAAKRCSVGLATWDRLTAAGRNPAPVKLGGLVCWSVAELKAWAARGCPPRDEWEPVWNAILSTGVRKGGGR